MSHIQSIFSFLVIVSWDQPIFSIIQSTLVEHLLILVLDEEIWPGCNLKTTFPCLWLNLNLNLLPNSKHIHFLCSACRQVYRWPSSQQPVSVVNWFEFFPLSPLNKLQAGAPGSLFLRETFRFRIIDFKFALSQNITMGIGRDGNMVAAVCIHSPSEEDQDKLPLGKFHLCLNWSHKSGASVRQGVSSSNRNHRKLKLTPPAPCDKLRPATKPVIQNSESGLDRA